MIFWKENERLLHFDIIHFSFTTHHIYFSTSLFSPVDFYNFYYPLDRISSKLSRLKARLNVFCVLSAIHIKK